MHFLPKFAVRCGTGRSLLNYENRQIMISEFVVNDYATNQEPKSKN